MPRLEMDITELAGSPSVGLEIDDGTHPVFIEIPDVLEMRSLTPLNPMAAIYTSGQHVQLSASPARDMSLREPDLALWLDGRAMNVDNLTYSESGTIEFDVPLESPPGDGFVHARYSSWAKAEDVPPTTCSGATECRVKLYDLEAYTEASVR